ncbi:MAG TPA: hypothetical protein DDZ51_11220 [Planctomycetaceae bacterium]|nr:hypothetical protein [Planctomycetaceae bacterium]
MNFFSATLAGKLHNRTDSLLLRLRVPQRKASDRYATDFSQDWPKEFGHWPKRRCSLDNRIRENRNADLVR